MEAAGAGPLLYRGPAHFLPPPRHFGNDKGVGSRKTEVGRKMGVGSPKTEVGSEGSAGICEKICEICGKKICEISEICGKKFSGKSARSARSAGNKTEGT